MQAKIPRHSSIFDKLTQQVAEKAAQPSSQILPDPEAGPIYQQSFAMPGTTPEQRTPVDSNPVWTGGQTYVPGIGMLGPDLGGAVAGAQARQAFQLKAAENTRAEERLGMDKSKLGMDNEYLKIAQANLGISLSNQTMKTVDWERDQDTLAGMADAAKNGGYAGAIDFLKTVDPRQAIQFEAAKLKVDDAILSNDVLQATVPALKGQALMDTYKLGAQMSMAVLQAPPEQQEEVYQGMKQLMDPIIPGLLPKNFDSQAQALGMLMMAQGMPQNQLKVNQGMQNYASLNIGKLNLARNELIKQGFSPESKEVKQIDNQLEMEDQKLLQSSIQVAKADAELKNKGVSQDLDKARIALSFTSQLRQSSKYFIDQMPTLKEVKDLSLEAQNQFQKTGSVDSALLTRLNSKVAKVNAGVGPMSDQDMNRVKIANGWQELSKNVQGWMKGENLNLNKNEVNQILKLTEYMEQKQVMAQTVKEQTWMKAMQESNIDPKSIVFPSQEYANDSQAQDQQSQPQQAMSREQIDAMAQEALQAKKDPQAVEQMRAQLYQQAGIK